MKTTQDPAVRQQPVKDLSYKTSPRTHSQQSITTVAAGTGHRERPRQELRGKVSARLSLSAIHARSGNLQLSLTICPSLTSVRRLRCTSIMHILVTEVDRVSVRCLAISTRRIVAT